jgi:hypothetical protein
VSIEHVSGYQRFVKICASNLEVEGAYSQDHNLDGHPLEDLQPCKVYGLVYFSELFYDIFSTEIRIEYHPDTNLELSFRFHAQNGAL